MFHCADVTMGPDQLRVDAYVFYLCFTDIVNSELNNCCFKLFFYLPMAAPFSRTVARWFTLFNPVPVSPCT